MLTAQESVKFFARHNKLQRSTWTPGVMTSPSTEVQLYSIENGNHGWPRESYHLVAATQIIGQFFKTPPPPTSAQD